MKIDYDMAPDAAAKEISVRVKQYRISSEMTQADLAKLAGVSIRTVAKVEHGEDTGFLNIIKILKALKLQGHMDVLIPDMTKRPSYHIDKHIYQRKRVRKKYISPKKEWKWGDEY